MPEARRSRSLLVTAEFAEIIGDICVMWNLMEQTIGMLFMFYMRENAARAYAISNILGNQSRADVLAYLVDSNEEDETLADLMRHFIAAFSICRDNRNILVHGAVSFGSGLSIKHLEKPSRSNVGAMVRFAYDLEAIRKVHQDILNTLTFGKLLVSNPLLNEYTYLSEHLDQSAAKSTPLPLPTKPPLPSRLNPIPPELRKPPEPV